MPSRLKHVFFTSKIASIVLADYLKTSRELRKGEPASHALSPREREIIQLLAEGRSNKRVADILNISVKTAEETHRHRIMQKLELESIVDLVHYAIRNHVVQP